MLICYIIVLFGSVQQWFVAIFLVSPWYTSRPRPSLRIIEYRVSRFQRLCVLSPGPVPPHPGAAVRHPVSEREQDDGEGGADGQRRTDHRVSHPAGWVATAGTRRARAAVVAAAAVFSAREGHVDHTSVMHLLNQLGYL